MRKLDFPAMRSLLSGSISYVQRTGEEVLVASRLALARSLLAIARRLDDELVASPTPPRSVKMPNKLSQPQAVNAAVAERTLLLKAMLGIALLLWRARRRLRQDLVEGSTAHAALRHLDQAFGILQECGFEIEDYSGQGYDAGMSAFVSPVGFQEQADCASDTIVETLAPAILYRRKLLTKSEVIVGVPLNPSERQAPAVPVGPPPTRAPLSHPTFDGQSSAEDNQQPVAGSLTDAAAAVATQNKSPHFPLAEGGFPDR